MREKMVRIIQDYVMLHFWSMAESCVHAGQPCELPGRVQISEGQIIRVMCCPGGSFSKELKSGKINKQQVVLLFACVCDLKF